VILLADRGWTVCIPIGSSRLRPRTPVPSVTGTRSLCSSTPPAPRAGRRV
jgi:hypothetical protein